jgi:hypothetical protein
MGKMSITSVNQVFWRFIMRKLLMILFIQGLLLTSSGVFAFQNEPDNFRGIKWGINLNKLHDMQKITEMDEMGAVYTRKGDKMKIGDANLDHVYYVFYKDRFYAIFIKISFQSDFDKIKATLNNVYGEAAQANPFIEEYVWDGNEVMITLKSGIFGDATLNYGYKPIGFEILKEQNKKAKEGTKDL